MDRYRRLNEYGFPSFGIGPIIMPSELDLPCVVHEKNGRDAHVKTTVRHTTDHTRASLAP